MREKKDSMHTKYADVGLNTRTGVLNPTEGRQKS